MTEHPPRRVPDLRLDGEPAKAALAACAVSVAVRHALGAPALAEIAFADPDPAHLVAVRIGATVELRLRSGEWLFDGEITAIEHEADGSGGRIVRARAYDRLHRLRKRQRPRALSDVTLATLIVEAAADIGASTASIPDAPRRPLLIQHDQSDFDLIADLAGASGLYLRLQDGTLDACSLAGGGEPAIPLALGAGLLAARATANAETLRKSTSARAWDPITLASVDATVGLARQDAVEFRDIGISAFPDLGERILTNRIGADRGEAEGLAQADMDRSIAQQLVLEATAAGDPTLLPGRVIAVSGLAEAIDGDFVPTTTLHRFDEAGGYVVELSTAPPPRAARAKAPAVAIAQIIEVDDPQRLGRARAMLPSFGEVETGWMPVMSLGAGSGKGAIMLPEVGDDALVLLPDGDPARGLILGGLYGAGDVEDGLAWQGVPRGYVLHAPGGQKLTLHGSDKLCRLETGAGDVLEFGPTGARLSATRNLVIEAPGRRMVLRAAAIDFERG
ncbi:phage baseplate assembly protein V [Sphingomonas sp. DT-204]|uniref:phage baseplate assembly protein V n=1 Tax=Sphingomonas sp. DT-204 TaxID=3396166 RepID=UPI003F1AC2CB